MATYFILSCPTPALGADRALLTYLADDDGRSWEAGVPFSTDPNDFPEEREPPLPVRFCITKAFAGALRELWEAPAPLMTRRLVDALRDGGVENLQTYEAVIDDQASGQRHTQYVAFNLIGLAKTDPELGWSDPSVFSTQPPPTPLLFRLRHQPYYLVVHERLKAHLQAAGFETLRFTDPKVY